MRQDRVSVMAGGSNQYEDPLDANKRKRRSKMTKLILLDSLYKRQGIAFKNVTVRFIVPTNL